MDAVILAAGYATRLGEIARGRPKALLPVGGRPVLDHLVERLAALDDVGRAVVVSNARFAADFRSWAAKAGASVPVRVVDDGTTHPGERLGAVGDLALGVAEARVEGDALIAAGDNIFGFDLDGLVERFRARPGAAAAVPVVEEDDPDALRRTGVAVVDDDDRIVRLAEKPVEPPSSLSVPALYLLRAPVRERVEAYLASGGDADETGRFLAWLARRETVVAWRAPGPRYDVGTPESYREARARVASGGEG